MKLSTVWLDGLWDRNPGLIQLLGLCPLLAVSNTLENAIGLGPGIVGVHSGQNFHQRRFTRTVLADQSMDFAREEFNLTISQCHNLPEALPSFVQSEKGGRSVHRLR